MTFKEVDEKISHYEVELKKCADEIAQTELFLKNDNDDVKNLAKAHKLKVEFFCFVTTSYIDWLCVYRNLQRSKSEWENYYNIKIAYLIAYETINTYYKFKGDSHAQPPLFYRQPAQGYRPVLHAAGPHVGHHRARPGMDDLRGAHRVPHLCLRAGPGLHPHP